MAVIVQSDPHQMLIRKVGYSVGLESLVERASALANMYADKKRITLSDWRDLVANVFHR